MRPEWHAEAIRLYDTGRFTQKTLAAHFGKCRTAINHALNRSATATGKARRRTDPEYARTYFREYMRKRRAAARTQAETV